MKSIRNNVENEYIIKKSKFISKIYRVNDIDEINKTIFDIKKEYKDATHICYAYIINNIKRFSDDNEPSGTAGIPILNVLENNNLNYILCIVIRYFGGIKLGAGGLVRAYSKAASVALKETDVVTLVQGKIVEITFTYDKLKPIENLLSSFSVLKKEFNDNIKFTFEITDEELKNLNIQNLCIDTKIIKDNLIVKF